MALSETSTVVVPGHPLPKRFHIFGNGISFSISPTIHNAGFKHHGLPHTYDIRESPDIDGVGHLITSEDFGGASVTMPHKLQVHKFCHQQTETGKLIGAINTLVVRGDGDNRVIIGDNTDWSGLYSIMSSYKKRRGRSLETGLVIGAGGASRAALYAMHHTGVQNILLWNRTPSVAESVKKAFAGVFDITILPRLEDVTQQPDVLIGTIPADVTTHQQFHGIFGKSKGLCIDMAYKPRETPLLRVAKSKEGWETITGVQVLLAQGFDQYRLWTGLEAPRHVIVDAVVAHENGEKIEIEGKL
jgi:shikimate-5-dehydrogenase